MNRKKAYEKWESLVIKFRNSSTSQVEFSKAHGIKSTTFSYWLKKVELRETEPAKQLVRISKPEREKASIHIQYKGMMLDIPDDTETNKILNLLVAMKGI